MGIQHVFAEDPIRWLNNAGVYTAASLQLVYRRIFSHLPHYKKSPIQLSQGLKVPGCVKSEIKIKSNLKLCISEDNIGSDLIAEEIWEMLSASKGSDKGGEKIEIWNYNSTQKDDDDGLTSSEEGDKGAVANSTPVRAYTNRQQRSRSSFVGA